MKYINYVASGSNGDVMEGTAAAIFGMDGSAKTDDFADCSLDDLMSGPLDAVPNSSSGVSFSQSSSLMAPPSSSPQRQQQLPPQPAPYKEAVAIGTVVNEVPSRHEDVSGTQESLDDIDDYDDVDKFFEDDSPVATQCAEGSMGFNEGFVGTMPGTREGRFYEAASNFVSNHKAGKDTSPVGNTLVALLQKVMSSPKAVPPSPPSSQQQLLSVYNRSNSSIGGGPLFMRYGSGNNDLAGLQGDHQFSHVGYPGYFQQLQAPQQAHKQSTQQQQQQAHLQSEQNGLEQILKGVTSSVNEPVEGSAAPLQHQNIDNECNLNIPLQDFGTGPQSAVGTEQTLPKMPESSDLAFIDPAIITVATSGSSESFDNNSENSKANEANPPPYKEERSVVQVKIERPPQQQQQLQQPQLLSSSQPKGDNAKKEKNGIKIQRPSVINSTTKDIKNTGTVNSKRKSKKQPPAEEKAPEENNGQKRKLHIVRKATETKSGWKTVEATKPFSQILLEDAGKK